MPKEYSVQIEDDVVTPEETLLDSGSGFSDIERSIAPEVFKFMFWGISFILGVIFVFSAKLSIANFDYYSNLAAQNSSANFSITPIRGMIFDIGGEALVKNEPQFDVIGVSREVKTALKEQSLDLEKLASALQIPVQALHDDLAAKVKESSIFFLANNLKKDQILAVKSSHVPGIYVIPDVERTYVDGPAFSAVLGYVGKVSKEDLARDPYYKMADFVGRLGIEAQYEAVLRGEHGYAAFGSEVVSIDPKVGQNLVLNIDADLQRRLYSELRGILAEAGLSRGAAIIQNPQTGAVLAMVSFPGYDNNQFSQSLSQSAYEAIFQSSARPLFNRVISGLYNPGSTIKPLIGLMALEEKVVSRLDTIQDCVGISIPNPFNPDVVYTFKNWRAELGEFNLRRAIANSCNVYFYTVGGGFGKISGLGISRIVKYLQASFADLTLGIDLPSEAPGFVPTPEWKEKTRGEPWYQGDTYNVSIGQGDLSVTPLWLNTYISAVANGGAIYQPQIANRVIDRDKNTVKQFGPNVLSELPFKDKVIAEVKSDMEETVLSGTAQALKDLPIRAGAKTGTAEVVKGQSINSLFTAFAPFDEPQIAITVLVENSPSNQGLAIKTAHNVLKYYFNKPANY